MKLFQYELSSNSDMEIINIDEYITDAVSRSNIDEGILTVYCPHTTAAITINENGDPDVKKDMIAKFRKISPKHEEYKHYEGNSHAHVLSSLIGASENMIISNNRLLLGTWQSIYFCEFDGPRKREIYVKII